MARSATALRPTDHATRTWCTFDAERDELTVVRDGAGGISTVTISREQALAALPDVV